MKLIKAKIKVVHPDDKSTQYVGYPKIWLDNKERIPAILMQENRSDEEVINGETYQIMFPLVPDDLEDEFLKIENFSKPTRGEVVSFSEKHSPVVVKVTDEQAVLAIVAKSARGEVLTTHEKDVLDPDSPVKGVQKTKPWLEAIEEQYGDTGIV